MRRRSLIQSLSLGAAAMAAPHLVLAQNRPLKIGVVTDYAGIYSDMSGPGEEYGVRMAIEDFKGSVLGRPIEVMVADHQNKADVATGITKRWIEVDKVDMLIPGGSSSAALAVQGLARENGIVTNVASPGALNFTEQDCSPLGFHWQVDSYTMPRASVLASGVANKKWFFIVLDAVFGLSAADGAAAAIKEAGGEVIGTVKHAMNTTDFASFIARAQASRADVIALITSGGDLIRALKQMREFGVQRSGQLVVAPFANITDILGAGLEAAQGMRFADGLYWDQNEATRAYAKRFMDKMGRVPVAGQAYVHAAVTHYLQAVAAVKSTDGKAVAARMRSQPITSRFFSNAAIRSNGRVVFDLNTVRVKSPAQSKGKYDIYEVTGSVPGDKVFKPLAQTECKLV